MSCLLLLLNLLILEFIDYIQVSIFLEILPINLYCCKVKAKYGSGYLNDDLTNLTSVKRFRKKPQ